MLPILNRHDRIKSRICNKSGNVLSVSKLGTLISVKWDNEKETDIVDVLTVDKI